MTFSSELIRRQTDTAWETSLCSYLKYHHRTCGFQTHLWFYWKVKGRKKRVTAERHVWFWLSWQSLCTVLRSLVDITALALCWLFSMRWFVYWPLYMEGRERAKKKAAHSRLVGGKSNKPGSLLIRLSCMKTRWVDLHTYPENLKSLYRGLNWVSHVFSPQGLSNTLLSLGTGPTMRAEGRGQGRGWGALMPRASSRVSRWSRPLVDLLHHFLFHNRLLQFCMSPFP